MYSFTVERINNRRPSPEKLVAQLHKMVKAALRGNRGTTQGWRLVNRITAPSPIAVGDNWKYSFTFQFVKDSQRACSSEIANKQFEVLMDMAQNAGNIHNWSVMDVNVDVSNDDENEEEEFDEELTLPLTPLEFDSDGDINLNPNGFFDHIYNLDHQRNVVLSALRTAVDSGFRERPHCLIEGDPAGGKTTFCRALIDMVGEEKCLYIDGTTATKAGVIAVLMDAPSDVNVLVIEEIEKIKDKDDLKYLLGIMDDRGEINVINSKVGHLHRKMPLFVVATVNDTAKFDKFFANSLGSRFPLRVYFPALTRETIYKAVLKGVAAVNGDPSWINPAIDYCMTHENNRDIRRIKAVCLAGRERLLTGEWQRILRSASRP